MPRTTKKILHACILHTSSHPSKKCMNYDQYFGDFWHLSCIKSHEWMLRCFEDPQPRLVPLGRCAHPTTSEISGWKIQWGHFFIFLQLGSMVAYKISSRNARSACRDQTCEQKFGMNNWNKILDSNLLSWFFLTRHTQFCQFHRTSSRCQDWKSLRRQDSTQTHN